MKALGRFASTLTGRGDGIIPVSRCVLEWCPKRFAATRDNTSVFRHYGFAAPPLVYRRVACPMFVSSIPIGRRYRLRPGHPSLRSPSIAGSAIAPGRGRQMTANNKILLYVPIGFLLIAIAVAIILRALYLLILHGFSSIPLLWPFLILAFLLLLLALRFI